MEEILKLVLKHMELINVWVFNDSKPLIILVAVRLIKPHLQLKIIGSLDKLIILVLGWNNLEIHSTMVHQIKIQQKNLRKVNQKTKEVMKWQS